MSPPLTVTEDTPADMLAGSMDLDIVLPSGQIVRNSVLRSTPMMDLLVQITTAHRLSPGSHSLQAMGERGALPYKPSTPIGALDTFTVKIVQKKNNLIKKAPQVPTVLPTTFRLSVHLPRSQLFVMRVTPAVTIGDIMQKVSDEKNLDVAKYELRKSGSMNQPLKSNQAIGELDTQELTLVVKGSDHVRQMSSADIMHVKQANRLNSAYDSSLSSGSLDSRSISPVAQTVPQVPQRKKRRPAPKPPEINQMRISHSRESSDSSGYHEPSTLSESPTHGRPASDARHSLAGMAPRNSHSLSNLTSLPAARLANSSSVTSLSSNGGKKKRAPPPPALPTPTINGEKPKSATLPGDTRRAAPAGTLPPAPVELAPSPPTSPDLVPPVPKPRLSKSPSLRLEDARPVVKSDEASEVVLKPEITSGMPSENLPEVLEEVGEKLIELEMQDSVDATAVPASPKKDKHPSQKQKTKYPTVQNSSVSSLEDSVQKSRTKEVPSEVLTLREIRSSPVLTKKLSDLPKIQSADMKTEGFEFKTMSRWGEVSNLNLDGEVPKNAEFLLGSSSTLDRRDSFDSEDEEMQTGDTFEEQTSDISKEPATASSEGVTTDGESQPDSLTVDWEYQLPPPPSHFRDLPAQASPSPTDAATLGTLDTLNTLIVDKSATLRKLNGIYEDSEAELKLDKISHDEPDRVRIEDKKEPINNKGVGIKEKMNVGEIERRGSLGANVNGCLSESEKVLVHKSEVMNELTNVLSRSRLPEKSQSYSNLYFPSAHLDSKKKSSTLSHSQSFLNPPIANFKITNYDERPKPNDDGFKKPAVPAVRPNGLRRADSMNVKKVNVDSMEKLQQQFLQFLQEKQLLDSGVEFEDLHVVPVVKSKIDEIVEDNKTVPALGNKADSAASVKVDAKVERKPVEVVPKAEVKLEIKTETVKVNGASHSQKEKISIVEIRPKEVEKQESVRRVSAEMTTKDEETVPKVVAMEPKRDPVRRSSYQPPAISMGTWGDRPRAKVVIKDDDYITQEELTKKWATLEKSASMSVVVPRPEVPRTEPKVESVPPPEKKTVISFKKPTNYELFSALNKRMELEKEDEASKLPKVCAVELKKDFRPEPDLIQDLKVEKKITKVDEVPRTTSVYLNGAPKPWNVEAQNATKVRPGLFPVVKGFRSIPSEVSNKTPELLKQESFPSPPTRAVESIQRPQSLPARASEIISGTSILLNQEKIISARVEAKSQGIPPPPPMGSISLKPVGARVIKSKSCDEDPRGQLLEQIRSFGGSGRLRKTVQ